MRRNAASRQPQNTGALIHDPSVTVVTIWTQDGHSVVMTPSLAREFALDILKITSPLSNRAEAGLPVGRGLIQ